MWTETSGKEAKLPNFELLEAAATPEELQRFAPQLREVSHDDYITMKRGQYRRQQGVFWAAADR